MGITKTELFEEKLNTLAARAKALGHPARLAIVEYILDHRTCICNDLVHELPLSQSTITQHLRELKQAGLIKGEIDGPKVNYCIDEAVWAETQARFAQLFSRFMPDNDCNCC